MITLKQGGFGPLNFFFRNVHFFVVLPCKVRYKVITDSEGDTEMRKHFIENDSPLAQDRAGLIKIAEICMDDRCFNSEQRDNVLSELRDASLFDLPSLLEQNFDEILFVEDRDELRDFRGY